MTEIFQTLTNPTTIVSTFGTIGIVLIIFLETGALFGFFLPGDSLLFTAGFFASQGYIPLGWLLVGTFLAAICGDSLGYAFGKKAGPALFTKDQSFFFNKKHILRAEQFFEKHGKKTIILARFIPIVRTFAPIVAGVGKMEYKTFMSYNIIGGLLWVILIVLAGYGFGSFVPNPDRYLLPAILVIIIISAAPALREILKNGIRQLRQ